MLLNFFLIPLLATLCFIAVLYPFAAMVGLIDKPCHRKQHKQSTPLIGGLAIYLALALTLILNKLIGQQLPFLTAITLLVCVGLLDDYRGVGVRSRIFAQIIAGLIMTEYAGIKIDNVGDIFGYGDIHLGAFSTAFTVFAIVGGINAFNMVDGMDGLAGCLTLVSVLSLAILAWIVQDDLTLNTCLALIACTLAFLSMNMRIFGRANAKIFLGDNGSTLLGFSVCWLAIDLSQGERSLVAPATVLWIIALPLFDSVCIMIRRICSGKSPFDPDREHLHHAFIVSGHSTNFTLMVIVLASSALSLQGIIAEKYLGFSGAVLFWAYMLLFFGHLWLMNRAWKIMKISRYVRETKVRDRRSVSQMKMVERRRGLERRYVPTEHEVRHFFDASNGFLVRVFAKAKFRAKGMPERRRERLTSYERGIRENRRSTGDRRASPESRLIDDMRLGVSKFINHL